MFQYPSPPTQNSITRKYSTAMTNRDTHLAEEVCDEVITLFTSSRDPVAENAELMRNLYSANRSVVDWAFSNELLDLMRFSITGHEMAMRVSGRRKTDRRDVLAGTAMLILMGQVMNDNLYELTREKIMKNSEGAQDSKEPTNK